MSTVFARRGNKDRSSRVDSFCPAGEQGSIVAAMWAVAQGEVYLFLFLFVLL